MDGLLLTCRLLLAAVLLVAAVAKLADRAGARRSLEGFGVPTFLAPAAALALPIVELLAAIALLPTATAWAGAVAATALLVVFSAAVATAIARGIDADCHCFGNLASARVGYGTLARNLALLVPAAVLAISGDTGASVTPWLGELAIVAALAVNFAFLFQLMKQNGRLWAEVEQLRGGASVPSPAPAVGDPAPGFALPDLSGELVELDDLLDGDRGVLMAFTDPACAACDPLLPEIGRRQRDPDADPRVVLVSLGSAEDIRAKVSDHGIDLVLLADDFELARSFGVTGLPGVITLDPDGRFAGEPALGTSPAMTLFRSAFDAPRLVQVNGRG
jgi:methylamine dehydrogenase accessory protein MauD